MSLIFGIMYTPPLERRQFPQPLGVPHLLQLALIDLQPFLHKLLSLAGEVSFCHGHCLQVKDSDMLTIQSVDVTRLMFSRLEKHLDNYAVESANLRHHIHSILCYGLFLLLILPDYCLICNQVYGKFYLMSPMNMASPKLKKRYRSCTASR